MRVMGVGARLGSRYSCCIRDYFLFDNDCLQKNFRFLTLRTLSITLYILGLFYFIHIFIKRKRKPVK